MGDRIFKEEQQFSRWWIMTFLAGLPILILTSQSTGDYIAVWIALPFFAVFTYLFVIARLRTRLSSRTVEFQFSPFLSRKYDWSDIESAEVIDYGFVGGWGIRLGTKYGTVYNVSGKMGLQLRLKNGKRIVIGTQKPEQIQNWLESKRNIELN
jgi:hypothetical protein